MKIKPGNLVYVVYLARLSGKSGVKYKTKAYCFFSCLHFVKNVEKVHFFGTFLKSHEISPLAGVAVKYRREMNSTRGSLGRGGVQTEMILIEQLCSFITRS